MQTQQNQNQKESAFTNIKKSLGLVSSEAKDANKDDQQEQMQEEEEEDGEESEAGEETMGEFDPFALLEGQHREVDALFAEIEGASDKAYKTKERLVKTLAEKLEMHADLEERIFYKAAREADEDLVLESYEEHAAMKNMLKRLANTQGNDESFNAKVTVLKETVEHHVKEEENTLFPKCREVFDEEELEELGHAMMARMEKAQEQMKGKARAKRTTKAKAKTTARKRTTRSKKRAA